MTAKNRKAFASLDFDMDLGGPFSFSDHDSGQAFLCIKLHISPFFLLIGNLFYRRPENEVPRPTLLRRTTIGNGTHFVCSYSIHVKCKLHEYFRLVHGYATELICHYSNRPS
jgi:hypothetical protein